MVTLRGDCSANFIMDPAGPDLNGAVSWPLSAPLVPSASYLDSSEPVGEPTEGEEIGS
jgi:hypothetical protein